jgi:predicted adenylyl cyclase CyaB
MDDNIEVELRVILNDSQEQSLVNTLTQNSAKYHGEEEITDVYFCKNTVEKFSQTAMNEVGSFSLRLREMTNDLGTQASMNVKIITKQGDHHAWEEHETDISSLKEAAIILKTLGFKIFFRLKKKRKVYKIAAMNMTVNIENIDGFGTATEVEIITTQQKAEQAKQQIKDYLATAGISEDQIVPKSITSILMDKFSRFDNSLDI